MRVTERRLSTLISSALHRSTSSRVKVSVIMSVQTDIKDVGVVVKALLSAVSMVDSPVNDKNFADNSMM